MKIVVLEADSVGRDVSWDGLQQFGELITYANTPDAMIAERIREADIIIPNKCRIREENAKDASRLRLICEAATGYNNIDMDYCKKRGITVTNVRAYSTESVVQHTFALLLQILESLDDYAGFVESGEYAGQESFTQIRHSFHELAGMRFGIIGLGTIGRRTAQVAEAFGMEVVYYSAGGKTYDVPYRAVDFETLLAESDVISCHAPLNEKTQGLMNRAAFKKMKNTAIFLNLGRGPIVVEEDLAEAIRCGEIQVAGLDVFTAEPMKPDSPLLTIQDRDRLFLTPHIAWASIESRKRLVKDVEQSIAAFLRGEERSVVSV